MYAVHDVIWQYLTGGKWDKKEDKVGKKRLVTIGYGFDLFGGGFYCDLAALLSFKNTLWVCMLVRSCPCAAHLHHQDVTVFLFYYKCPQIIDWGEGNSYECKVQNFNSTPTNGWVWCSVTVYKLYKMMSGNQVMQVIVMLFLLSELIFVYVLQHYRNSAEMTM